MDARRNNSDWVGRFLGMLGLVAGAGTLAYVASQNPPPQAETAVQAVQAVRLELSHEFSRQLELQRKAYDEALTTESARFNDEWNRKLDSAVAEIRQDAGATLKRLDTESSSVVSEVRQARSDLVALLGEVRQLTSDQQVPANGPATQLAAATLVEPSLRQAQQVLKPSVPADARILVIKNDGAQEAMIKRIVFRALDRFELDAADLNVPSPSAMSVATTRIMVEYLPTDNASANTESHNVYAHDYPDAIVVPGQAYASMQVVIRNSEHVRWGLIGDLTVEYASGKTLEIPGARAIFEPASEDRT